MKMKDENEFPCPKCKSTWMVVVKEWVNMHEREVLLHCYDCDKKFIVYYKFDKIVELIEEEIVVKELGEKRVELMIPMDLVEASLTPEARARDKKMMEEFMKCVPWDEVMEFWENWKKERKEKNKGE